MNGYQVIFKETNLPTEVPPVQQYVCLNTESDSGMRYRSGDVVLPLTFGSCTGEFRTWPPDVAEQYKHLHVFPLNYQCHIQTGWSIEKVGSAWEVERVMEWFPAAVVREYLEIQREIELLAGVVARGRA